MSSRKICPHRSLFSLLHINPKPNSKFSFSSDINAYILSKFPVKHCAHICIWFSNPLLKFSLNWNKFLFQLVCLHLLFNLTFQASHLFHLNLISTYFKEGEFDFHLKYFNSLLHAKFGSTLKSGSKLILFHLYRGERFNKAIQNRWKFTSKCITENVYGVI